jgi:hypothetical protein
MRPERSRTAAPLRPRREIEGELGALLLYDEEPIFEEESKGWTSWLEMLGGLCVEAWHDDLLEEDSAWAAAHREKFNRWTKGLLSNEINTEGHPGSRPSTQQSFDELLVLPWAMALEAVRSALLVAFDHEAKTLAADGEPVDWDPATRVEESHVIRTLTAEGAAEAICPRLLRAFRRGFRLARRGWSKAMSRPIPPPVTYRWLFPTPLKRLPGPRAARQLALQEEVRKTPEVPNWRGVYRELQELCAEAWRDDLPPEDQLWAWYYRLECKSEINSRRLFALGESAFNGYLASSGGLVYGEPEPRDWRHSAWYSFVERVEDAPEGESELETAEAAVREFWDARYKEPPPWEGDPNQIHWLAAVRAVREAALTYVPPQR